MKRIFSVIVAVFIVLLIFLFSKNMIAKSAITMGVNAATGLSVSLKGVDIGIIKTNIDINGLRIFNPQGFSDQLMADVPEIYIEYDLPAILRKKIHLTELRLNIQEFIVIRNAEGAVNINSIKGVKGQKEKPSNGKSGPAIGTGDISIDRMTLKIGKVYYKDYSRGGKPNVREFNINIDETYEDIDSLNDLMRLVAYRAIVRSKISNLVNVDLGALTSGIDSTLLQLTGIAGGAAGKTLKAGEELGSAAKDAAKGVAESLKSFLPIGTKAK